MKRTLLVSADLTADEISATGGHRRFVPRAPAPGDFSRGFRPAYADNDPQDHCPGASALLDLNSGYCLICNICLVPVDAGRNTEVRLRAVVLLARRPSDANPDAKHPGKARESSVGESFLSPSDVPRLFWARSPLTFRNPSAAGGACLPIPTK